ncbi:MAG: aminodeoxychorismate lyase [Shewanella sp.]|nr:aminodeoxychorismate lyase [Shewanella sp.]MCF1430645.1 aminodeoxychorismate lyase [Shewanella sp.]MCF1437337.1 aminodeoxychorismate lyase [Shewanella sp.]MCF1456954.1 aminodeoxychorismate lyase [Shewanella sp.]
MNEIWIGDVKENLIDPRDRALAYGDGLFATMKASAQQICYLDLHLRRLSDGAARLGFHWQISDVLRQRLIQLAFEHSTACIKLLLSRGVGGRGYQPPSPATSMVMISVHPIPAHYAQWQLQGIRLGRSPITLGRQPLLAGIKHLNRLEQVLVKAQLPDHVDDVWVTDCQGYVIEASAGNLFIINGNEAIVPRHSEAGVSGVMRQQVIQALLAMGLNISVEDVTEEQLLAASHIMVTNSLMGAVPVNCIANRPLARWTRMTELQQRI